MPRLGGPKDRFWTVWPVRSTPTGAAADPRREPRGRPRRPPPSWLPGFPSPSAVDGEAGADVGLEVDRRARGLLRVRRSGHGASDRPEDIWASFAGREESLHGRGDPLTREIGEARHGLRR